MDSHRVPGRAEVARYALSRLDRRDHIRACSAVGVDVAERAQRLRSRMGWQLLFHMNEA